MLAFRYQETVSEFQARGWVAVGGHEVPLYRATVLAVVGPNGLMQQVTVLGAVFSMLGRQGTCRNVCTFLELTVQLGPDSTHQEMGQRFDGCSPVT